MSKEKIFTGEGLYNQAKTLLDLSFQHQEDSPKHKGYVRLASKSFFEAFAFGEEKSVFALAMIFKDGDGVVKSDYLHKVFLYVAAEYLEDNRFNPEQDKLDSSDEVKKGAAEIYKFFDAYKTIFANGGTQEDLSAAMINFNKTVELNIEDTFMSFFLKIHPDYEKKHQELELNVSGEAEATEDNQQGICGDCVIL